MSFAAIGLSGGSKRVGDRAVPYYHLLVGGEVSEGAARFGTMVAKVPAKNVPAAVFRIIDMFRARRRENEIFLDWVKREEGTTGVQQRMVESWKK